MNSNKQGVQCRRVSSRSVISDVTAKMPSFAFSVKKWFLSVLRQLGTHMPSPPHPLAGRDIQGKESIVVKGDLHGTTLSHSFTTGLWYELFRVNQTYNLLTTVVYVTEKCVEWRELCVMLGMTRAARAPEFACDSRKQTLYRLNRP